MIDNAIRKQNIKSTGNKLIITGILLLGLFFRIHDLNVESLWPDEGIAIRLAHLDLSQIIKELENGFTFVQGNRLNRDVTISRSIFSWGFNLLVSLVKMERVRDIGCGLIGFPRTIMLHIQTYPGKIKDFVTLIMLNAKPVKKVDILVISTRKSKYRFRNLLNYSVYLIDQLIEYFWITKIIKKWQ